MPIDINTPQDPLDFTQRELNCILEAVWYEARGESPLGWEAVAATIINRMLDKRFPNNACEVVAEPYQYSYTLYVERAYALSAVATVRGKLSRVAAVLGWGHLSPNYRWEPPQLQQSQQFQRPYLIEHWNKLRTTIEIQVRQAGKPLYLQPSRQSPFHWDPTQGAQFYFNPKKTPNQQPPNWANGPGMVPTVKIGNHYFYRLEPNYTRF